MKQPITINDEVFDRCAGPKSKPLPASAIWQIIAVAALPADFSGRAFEMARRQSREKAIPVKVGSPREFWPTNSALEDFAVLYSRYPRAVLHVMTTVLDYLETRSQLRRAVAVRAKSLRQIADALYLDEATVRKHRTRLNRKAKDARSAAGVTE